ncbi:MAG: hypothetical protein AB7P01_11815 [Bacteroidia bacterium]
MYKAELNFDSDFNEMLINELSDYHYSVDISESSDKIKMKYFNFKRRLIQPIKRQIFISKEFTCPPDLQVGLDIVKAKFINGENVTPHLSKNLTNLDYNDSLLNDWGIYHLHLGTQLETNGSGFIERTGPVLFVRIDNDKALFIGVMPHGSWTKQQMIKVIHDNWEASIASYRMHDVIGLVHVPTDDDIKKMRKYGVNSGVEIEPGVVYLPIGGGLTTAKTSIEVSMAMIRYKKLLRQLEGHVQKNLQEIGQAVFKKSRRTDEILLIKLVIQDHEYYAVEQNTGIAFNLGKY